MGASPQHRRFRLTFIERSRLPIRERVADKMADMLFEVDDLLGILDGDESGSFSWMEPEIKRVYDSVNNLMQRVVD